GCAGEADSPVVLSSGNQPFPAVGIARHILNFGNRETLAEVSPLAPAIGRAVDTAVVSGIDSLGIARRERKTVLIRMYAVRALRSNVGPAPPRTREVASQGVNCSNVDLVLVVGGSRDIPIVPSLINVQRRGHTCNLGPRRATAAP